jgi:hypothetical protein
VVRVTGAESRRAKTVKALDFAVHPIDNFGARLNRGGHESVFSFDAV